MVNGSAEMSLFLVNSTSFEVAAPQAFNLTCAERDEPIQCAIPASYIYAAEAWDPASGAANVTLTARSVTHVLDSMGVQLTISPSCAPGFVVNIAVAGPRLQLLFAFFPVTNRSQLCKLCSAGTVSNLSDSNACQTCPAGTAAAVNHSICVSCFGNSWAPAGTQGSCINCSANFKTASKFDDCFSLVFSGDVPRSVVAQVPFELPCISIVNTRGEIMNTSHGNVSISLKCTFPVCTAASESVLFQDRIALSDGSACSGSKVFDVPSGAFVSMNVGEGFQWTLELSGSFDVGISVLQVISPNRSRFLGLRPAIIRVLPSRVSFLGSSVLSVTSSWPILPSIKLPANNRSEYCIFTIALSQNSVRHVSPALQSGDNQVRLCIAPAGPAFRFFELHVQLADERISVQPALIGLFCPVGYYVLGGECLQCPNGPSGSSASLQINASLIQSCICSIGSYGTHGTFCTTCPKVPALNCSQVGLVLPEVNPGFYADFSKLKDCSWTREECGAVTACLFGSRACPGGAELQCARSQAECYQGWGCAKCCKMYFLENSRCLACPDAGETMMLLGVLAGFAVAVGVMISSATSPSVINSVKYFVLSINFIQNVMALKLFDIPWPTVVLSFFDWLKFFSFSIAAVRPECAFSWDFETKVAITIISPMLLSLAIAVVGLIVGLYRCFKIFIKLDSVRRKLKNSIPYSTLASVIKCWCSVVLFLSVDYSEQTIIWFALSPYLSNRLQARSVKDAKTNWKTAASKLRGLSKASMFMKRVGVSVSLGDKLDYRDLTKLQDILKRESLDIDFARVVQQGRKFASGMFSVLVLSFVGTLTSILSVSKCSDRDGSSFLVQDQDIECSFGSSAYTRLFLLAIFGFFVYSVFLPLFILAILGSSWCAQMRMQDYAGYEAIFGFLVARYSRRHYRWEAMVFLMKSASVAVPIYFTNSPIRQSICMMFISFFYIVMLFKYSPFANHFLNLSEKVSNLSLFGMYFSAILFLGSVDSSPIVEGAMRQALGIWLCVICMLSILLTFWCAICELAFLALVHRDQFVSKWQAALAPHFGNSLKEGFPTPFAFLFVYYNAISRKDIGLKTRMYNEAVAEKLVKLEMANRDVAKRGFLFGIKSKWIYVSVGIELKFLAMCNPVTVLTVADSEDAKFLGLLSQLEYQLQRYTTSQVFVKNKISKLWSRISHYLRYTLRMKVAPSDGTQDNAQLNDDALYYLSAPQDVLSKVYKMRNFLNSTFSSSSRQTLMSFFLFDRSSDFGSTPESRKYYVTLMRQCESAKRCIQSLFLLEAELFERSLTVAGKLQYSERFAKSLIGRDASILSAFNHTKLSDLIVLFRKFKFEQTEYDDLDVPSIDELVRTALQSTHQEDSNETSPKLVEKESIRPSIRSRVVRNSYFSNMEAKLSSEDTSEVINPGTAFMYLECAATSDSLEYSGDLKEGLYEGIGTTVFRSGDRYEGHFACGQREGLGKFIWVTGDIYDGNWSKDMFEGFGALKCKSHTFEGDWVRGQRSGKGRIVFERGDIFDGNWEQNLYSGEGQYTFGDGRVLTGIWLRGKFTEESAVPAEETRILKTQIVPVVPHAHQTLSMHEMLFPSQIMIAEQERDSSALAKTTKLMQLLEDTRFLRKDTELAQNQLQETESKIQVLEEQRLSLRTEESHFSSRIAEVTEQIEQHKVQRRIQDIDEKVHRLREKRDAMVSEINLSIIEVTMAKIKHVENLKKELQNKLTIKRYKDYMKQKNGPKIQSKKGAIAELRAKMPALQYELNQTQVEMANLSMENFHLKRDLEPMLLENRSLRSQLGLGPPPNPV